MAKKYRALIFCVWVLISNAWIAEGSPVFTHPPTDIENVSGVIPLGNISPPSQHILPVDHMYLQYAIPNTGKRSYPVYAMGAGKIVMVTRSSHDQAANDYQIYIKHNRYVTSYLDHIYELSQPIAAYLETTGKGWLDTGVGNFYVMILGHEGAPAPLTVKGGDPLGTTRNYTTSWDVGVIDSRVKGSFSGKGTRRYPTAKDHLRLMGYPKIPSPYRGQQTINASSFIMYMPRQMKTAWFKLLLSEPKRHGQAGWDLSGRLRGAWFNPALDSASPAPLFDLEYAAISITPYNLAPTTKVQIAVAQGHPLSALDSAAQYPQLERAIVLDMNLAPGAKVNPNPAKVSKRSKTVCYDIPYQSGSSQRFNSLLFRLVHPKKVAIKFDPTPHPASDCANRVNDQPNGTWTIYRR